MCTYFRIPFSCLSFFLLLFSMATEKKAFILRIQPETLKELERWAQEEFRSVNGQIEYLLNDALHKRKKRNQNPSGDESITQSTT